jgi:cell division protein FtsA
VVNIESALRSVFDAIEAAEIMSGREVKSVWTGIGGSHIDGLNSKGVVAVTEKRGGREIGPEDIARVLEAAKAVKVPLDRRVLAVIPLGYMVDGEKGVRDPLNMIGVRLEADVHIITCSITGAQNVYNCVNRAGFRVDGLVLGTLASGKAVLTADEKNLGTALIDLGGGTTDIIIYSGGAPYSTATIPIGGIQVSNDISQVKNIAFEAAEKIKLQYGSCWPGAVDGGDDIMVEGIGGRPPVSIPREEIESVITPRMREIFTLAKAKIDEIVNPEKAEDKKTLGGGIVLSGGGALLPGAAELATEVFGLPARIGFPLSVGALAGLPGSSGMEDQYKSPEFASAVGLVIEGYEQLGGKEGFGEAGTAPRPNRGEGILGKIGGWFKKFF